MRESSWRSEPAAALRGFGAGFLPAATSCSFSRANAESGKVDLTAHLEQRGRLLTRGPSQLERDRADRAQVRGHLLAAAAVAARRAADEAAVLVDERDRGAVDLRLDHVGDRLVRVEPLAHVVGPLQQRLVGRHLLERAHRRDVLDLAKALRRAERRRAGSASRPSRALAAPPPAASARRRAGRTPRRRSRARRGRGSGAGGDGGARAAPRPA